MPDDNDNTGRGVANAPRLAEINLRDIERIAVATVRADAATVAPRQRVNRERFATRHPINDTDGCARCGCSFADHNRNANGPCIYCDRGRCPRFLTQDQVAQAKFFDFFKWAKKWAKANRNRKMDRLRQIWSKLGHSSGFLTYCPKCTTSTILNNNSSRVVAKRQDGLLCAACKRCAGCCRCVTCQHCNKRTTRDNICTNCNMCSSQSCCHCRTCNTCHKQCGDDNCGNCGYCNTCCQCGDANRVPFYTSYNRKPKFYKPTLKDHAYNATSRYIAAEIEVAGIRGNGKPIYQKVKDWGAAVVYDGSLPPGGFEINTSPAGGDLFVQQVQELCQVVKSQNGIVNERCGLHVHIDARDLNYYDIRRLVRIYAAIETALFAMCPPARQASRYCHPCGQKYIAAIEEGRLPYDKVKTDVITSVYESQGSTQDLRTIHRHPSRYNALNLHSWFYRGTIECRMFDGSIDADTISRWGILWAMILDYAVKTTDDEVSKAMNNKTFTSLMKIVEGQSKMIDFIRARVVQFGSEAVKKEMIEYMKSGEKQRENR